ncbi:Tfp pilus assembly protein PilF [Larkinella arboricola]|uniref:Tfp pilus assembly protein PilF n=1 Tax=Larkinella arboricola TaxID=643671 RepID=A0A327WMQ9_LARAB|nr:tetratricopeptide repeat protein [Larkinella arboricola]RAJ92108.1 Tfp pilus assembly protein PilF [Larkinella arboricola]
MPRLLCKAIVLFYCVVLQPIAGYSVELTATQSTDSVPRLNNTALRLARNKNYAGALQLLKRAAAGRPSDTLLYNQAIILSQLKRYEEAANLLQQVPAFSHAQANQGIFFCMSGDVKTGLTLLENTAGGKNADKVAFNRAVAHLHARQFNEANRAASEAVRIRGGEPIYRLVKADALLGLKKYQEALNAYQALEKDAKLATMLPVRIGNALLGLKKYEEAAASFTNYLLSGDRSNQAEARFGLANALYGQKEFTKAVAEFRRAVQFRPQWLEARTGLGNALSSTRDYRSARIEYEAALAIKPDDPHVHLGLGVVSHRQGLHEEALEHFARTSNLLDPKDKDLADCFLSLGLTKLEMNQLDSALVHLNVAMRLNKDHPAAYAGASEVYRKKESSRYTLEYLEKAIRLSPQNDKMLTNKGNMYLKLGNMDEAYESFHWALNHNPQNINALNGLSISLLEKDRIEEAELVLDSVITRGHHKAFLYNNRGIVRSYMALKREKQKDMHSARQYYYRSIRDYERSRDLDSTHKTYYNNLGNVYKNTGEYDKAVKSYLGHLDRSAINNLGVLYARNAKGDYGRHYLNIAITIDSASLVYRYNRYKVYKEFFKDSLAKRPDILQGQDLMPTNSISSKYSKDGYINIYLYDYDFEHYEFPGDHYFPIQNALPTPPDYRPLDDLIAMQAVKESTTARVAPPVRVTRKRMPKARRTRMAGSTKCPKIL